MPPTAAQLVTAEILLPGLASGEGSDSQVIVNVFHFRRTATVTPVSKVALGTAFNVSLPPAICAALNVTYSVPGCQVRMLEDVTDPYLAVNFGGGPQAGAITGDRRKPSDAAFLLCKTAFRGRIFRGSKHFSPMSESDTTTGTADLWNAGCLTRLSAIATAIMAGFTDSTGNVWKSVVWSRKSSDMTTVPATIITTDLSQCLVNKRIGSQKSRTVKSVY